MTLTVAMPERPGPTMHARLLGETSPKWPVRMKRPGPVAVTAVLPVAVPLVTTVPFKLVTG